MTVLPVDQNVCQDVLDQGTSYLCRTINTSGKRKERGGGGEGDVLALKKLPPSYDNPLRTFSLHRHLINTSTINLAGLNTSTITTYFTSEASPRLSAALITIQGE